MKTRPINKSNPKNVYCGHCEYFKSCSTYVSKCTNEKSDRFDKVVHYWNRCKCFEWRKDADYVE